MSIELPSWLYNPPNTEASIIGKPYITVSAKGISNGLSDIPNDGADFGPDTLQGVASPGYYGPPYSHTYLSSSGVRRILHTSK